MCHGRHALHPNWLVGFPLFFGLSSVRLLVSYFLIQIDSNILSQFLLVAHCQWLFSNDVAQSADVAEMGDDTMQFDHRLENADTVMVDELAVVEKSGVVVESALVGLFFFSFRLRLGNIMNVCINLRMHRKKLITNISTFLCSVHINYVSAFLNFLCVNAMK